MDGIDAFIEMFDHHIAGADDIGIVPRAAGEHIGRRVTGQDVVEFIACPVDGSAAGQGQILNIG